MASNFRFFGTGAVWHQIFEFLGALRLGKGPPLANTEVAIFINDFIIKSMLFRHVWIWTDLANGVRRFQGIGFGGHQGSSNLVERASGFEDLG